MAILLLLLFFFGKGHSLVYYTEGNLPVHTKFLARKKICWIYTSYQQFQHINTTVSSHLSGHPVQSGMKASGGNVNPTEGMLLPRQAAAAGDMARRQEQGRGGSGTTCPQPQRAPPKATVGKGNWVSKCSSANSTSRLML